MKRDRVTVFIKRVVGSSNIGRKGKTVDRKVFTPIVSTENIAPWRI